MTDVVCGKCGRPLTRVPQGWVDDTGSAICEKEPGIGHRPQERRHRQGDPRPSMLRR